MISGKNNQGLRRAMHILQALSHGENEGMTFSALREALGGIPATALSRCLAVLQDEGWVAKGRDGGYYPGDVYLQSAAHIFSQSVCINLDDIVSELANETGQTAAYAEYNDRGFVFRSKCEMPDSYHHIPVGKTNHDLLVNGYGVMCLACQAEATRLRVLADKPANEKEAAFKKHHQILKGNFYISRDAGGVRLIAPIFIEPQHAFFGAIGISSIGPEMSKIDIARYRKMVEAAAEKASSRIQNY